MDTSHKTLRPCLFTLLGLLLSLCTLSASPFERVVRPITNPVYHDLPMAHNYAHPLFIYQSHPDRVSTTAGNLPFGGDHQIYAFALEYALDEEWSIIASKDGYIDFNPDNTFTSESGFADIAAGVKWNFYHDVPTGVSWAARLLVELPTGDDDVFQGNGTATVSPAFVGLKAKENWQLCWTSGLTLALDDEESDLWYNSISYGYHVSENVTPLIELNHLYVMNPGDGKARFKQQAGGAVPGIARFEGGDMINFGASNAAASRNFISAAVGIRWRVSEPVDVGAAYEIPLTDEEESLMESRFTMDMIYRF